MERESELDRNFSDYEKQFAYLPLAILDAATNIRQLFEHITDKKDLDATIQTLHNQMPVECWAPELNNLRFIETTSDSNDDAIGENEEVATNVSVRPARRMTRLFSMRATQMEESPKPQPAKVEQVQRETRKRKVKPINQFISITRAGCNFISIIFQSSPNHDKSQNSSSFKTHKAIAETENAPNDTTQAKLKQSNLSEGNVMQQTQNGEGDSDRTEVIDAK